MTNPVFHAPIPAAAEPGAQLSFTGELVHHAVTVRKLGPGEHIDITDGQGVRITGPITSADPTALSITIEQREHHPAPSPQLVLVQALAKHERDLQAIESATEIGVDLVIPWAAARSVADWPRHKQAKLARKWANLLHAAALQSRRAHFPQLHELARGGQLPGLLTSRDLVLVLHESAEVKLTTVLARQLGTSGADEVPPYQRIVLIVGPEGGITPAEITTLAAAGAHPVLLGDTVLRSSSAGPAGLALCQAALGRW